MFFFFSRSSLYISSIKLVSDSSGKIKFAQYYPVLFFQFYNNLGILQ